VLGVRLVLLFATVTMTVAAHAAAPLSGPVPLPRPRPALKSDTTATTSPKKLASRSADTDKNPRAPLALAPGPADPSAAPSSPAIGAVVQAPPRGAAPQPTRVTAPFAIAATGSISPLDLSTVEHAIDLVRKNRQDEATDLEGSLSDPLARKLVEWVILRSEDGSNDYNRYAAFIAANPSWPSIGTLRRRAEAVIWQERADPPTVLAFFATEPPRTPKGRFALARALIARGDQAGAEAAIRETWRHDGFAAEVEAQARDIFAGLITPADDQIRMDARFYAEDSDAGFRAAHHLDAVALAIAKARAAVIDQSSKAKALLEAVPEAGRHEAGYMFSRAQWLRRSDKIVEAAQWIISAPRDPAHVVDPDQWWVERRLVARKLLDLGDARKAYEVADGAALPVGENYRAEQQFTAGWIALRFLHEPALAAGHFARIGEGVSNPITLARSSYWQGRAAEALGRNGEARAHYEEAARYPTAYYGQLARARLGIEELTLRKAPAPPTEYRGLELAHVFEILYAIEERDLVATMASDLADKATDAAALAALAEIATAHGDARSTLLIGKTALGHGLPLERYAFPDFGVPEYEQIVPEVERCVVFSIVRQESAFNPKVVSSANAIGLMQVTPPAGRDTAKKFNVSFDQQRLANDVVYNAQLGTAELGSDIESYRGSYILAFASYNAGRGRAKQWIDQYGDPRDPKVDPIDWIERIPFSETRNYVQRVIENMQVYRARIENDTKLLIEADLHRGG